jgi:hypothetical protein
LQGVRSSEAGAYTHSKVREEDVTNIKTRAEAEIKKVEDAINRADARARGIEQKANELYEKSQALLDRLKAAPR